MVGAIILQAGYAEAFVLGTRKDQFGATEKTEDQEGIINRRHWQNGQEMESLEHGVKAVEETYGGKYAKSDTGLRLY